MSADILVNSQKLFEDLVLGQIDGECCDRADYGDALAYQANAMSDPRTENLIVCSSGNETTYSCGLKQTEVARLYDESDSPFLPGNHVWARVMRKVLNASLGDYTVFNFAPKLQFMQEPIKFPESHPKTVLVVSNSLTRYIRSLEMGKHIVVPGATFKRLIEEINSKDIDVTQFHFVVLQAGVIECDDGREAEKSSMEALRSFLASITRNLDSPTFLVCPTFPYSDVHHNTRGYGKWLSRKLRDIPNVLVFDWDNVPSPFFPNGRRNSDLFDDKTHISRLGTMHLWRLWQGSIPQLSLISCDLHQYPYGKRPAEVDSASGTGTRGRPHSPGPSASKCLRVVLANPGARA
jgi:hypothetical protein